jgi:glycosyltransferase involved in cell wall biosynthesis
MPVRILHAHSTFALGGKEARAVALMNAFGGLAEHSILSSMPGQLAARSRIDPGIAVAFPEDAPPLAGRPSLARLFRLSRYSRGFDLVLTYNWGAFDMVMARHLFGGPPLVHHEDGFNEDEAGGLKPARNLYRRLGLSSAFRLVVPSTVLERIARDVWAQPADRVERIANGIRTREYARTGDEAAIPGLDKGPEEVVIGTLAGLRPVKNLPRLVRAFAAMKARNVRLVIAGEGPDSDRIMVEARRLKVEQRVLLPGSLDPARALAQFDIFALSSESEQFPIAVVEAMAAGLPVAATGVGDIVAMVADDNRPLIVAPDDEAALTAALDTLAERADLRRTIGLANRRKAAAEFDEERMIARYARLYGEAIGAPQAFIAALA